MRLVVVNHVTLDGVMQAPGAPDEDTRGGFIHGGWASSRTDDLMLEHVGKRMGGQMLLGHFSYDDMLGKWNSEGGPFKAALNGMQKWVASTNPDTSLEWPNSTLVSGDVPAAVAQIKASGEGDLVIQGSGKLIRSLLPHGLVDEFFLMIHPLVLGSGERLFGNDGTAAELRLIESITTTSGVVLATYRPA
jgi:dihydrofolate reductase